MNTDNYNPMLDDDDETTDFLKDMKKESTNVGEYVEREETSGEFHARTGHYPRANDVKQKVRVPKSSVSVGQSVPQPKPVQTSVQPVAKPAQKPVTPSAVPQPLKKNIELPVAKPAVAAPVPVRQPAAPVQPVSKPVEPSDEKKKQEEIEAALAAISVRAEPTVDPLEERELSAMSRLERAAVVKARAESLPPIQKKDYERKRVTDTDPNYFTITEIAEWLGLSKRTIAKYAEKYGVPFRYRGNRMEFHRDNVEALRKIIIIVY